VAELLERVKPSGAMARLGVALGDPIRQVILLRLSAGPAYPSDLAELVDTTKSNLSNHLACLRGCGLVVAEREGRNIRYELVTRQLGEAITIIADAVTRAPVVAHGR